MLKKLGITHPFVIINEKEEKAFCPLHEIFSKHMEQEIPSLAVENEAEGTYYIYAVPLEKPEVTKKMAMHQSGYH